jgi:enamine deaminase RidA (YjgF/YER057c/UK114 family)
VSFEIVRPSDVFPPVSQYSHGVSVEAPRLLFVAGQIALDASGTLVGPDDCAAQTRQAFQNIERVLAAAGASWGLVVRLTTYLVRTDDIPSYRAARDEVFSRAFPSADYPPHTLLVVRSLAAPEYLVEIEATAVTSPGPGTG